MNKDIILSLDRLGFSNHPGAYLFLGALYFSEQTDLDFEELVSCIKMQDKDKQILANEFAEFKNGKWISKMSITDTPGWDVLKHLLTSKGLGTNGVSENPLSFSIWGKDKELRKAFNNLKIDNLERACIVILDYYQNTKYAKSLLRFLEEDFDTAYKTFTNHNNLLA